MMNDTTAHTQQAPVTSSTGAIAQRVGHTTSAAIAIALPSVAAATMASRWILHGDWYPDYNLRLFHRGRARWGGDPHSAQRDDKAVTQSRDVQEPGGEQRQKRPERGSRGDEQGRAGSDRPEAGSVREVAHAR